MSEDLVEEDGQLQNGRSLRRNLAEFENLYQLIVTGARTVKASFVSAGNSMSFFPVAAAPAVPAPAPAAAPIAAPLRHLLAPNDGAARCTAADETGIPFALAPSVLPAELVAIVYVLPPTITVRSRR